MGLVRRTLDRYKYFVNFHANFSSRIACEFFRFVSLLLLCVRFRLFVSVYFLVGETSPKGISQNLPCLGPNQS